MVLITVPSFFALSLAFYQLIYWSNAIEINATLQDINTSSARQFVPGDIRRAETTEISVTFVDNKGNERSITQLSPLTKYFFSYGDELTIKYFNENGFEGTIWNPTIKFYYLWVFLAYVGVSSIFIGIAKLKNQKS